MPRIEQYPRRNARSSTVMIERGALIHHNQNIALARWQAQDTSNNARKGVGWARTGPIPTTGNDKRALHAPSANTTPTRTHPHAGVSMARSWTGAAVALLMMRLLLRLP